MNEHSLRVLEFPKVLEIFASYSSTDLGRNRLRSLSPFATRAEVVLLLDLTEDLGVFLSERKLPSYSLHDFTAQLATAGIPDSILTKAELWSVCASLRAVVAFREVFRGETPPHNSLSDLARQIRPMKDLMDGFRQTFDDTGEIRDDATDELRRIRQSIRETRRGIQKTFNGLLESKNFSSCLEDRELFAYEDRFVVRLKGQYKNKVRGIVHGASNSGQTVYFEPEELVDGNNGMMELASAESEEIFRILFGLTERVRGHLNDIADNLAIAGKFEQALANHRFSEARGAVRPVFNDEGIDLHQARHPLIPSCVAVDIRLKPPHRCLVVSGPNTGGKTAALKTAGLLCLMARAGLFIPAGPGSTLAFCEEVLIDIGDEQSLEQSLSTFSAHLTNLRRILEQSDRRSLVLIDEPGVGTEPEFGEVFAVTLLQELKDRDPMVFVTTHFKRVKMIGLNDSWFQNASVDYDPVNFSPRYTLLYGVPGDSQPMAVMARLGFPSAVLERARRNHSQETLDLSATIVNLSAEKRRLEEERLKAEARNAEYAEVIEAYNRKFDEVSAKEKKLKRDYRSRIQEFLADARKKFELIIKKIVESGRSKESIKEAKDLFAGLELQADGLEERLEAMLPPQESVAVGDTVGVKGQHYQGRVRTVKDGKATLVTDLGNITIDVGLLTKVPSQVRPVERRRPPAPPTRTSPPPKTVIRDAKTTLDLRGLYQMEALPRLEEFFDQSLLDRRPYVFIIHGKGTGKLKEMTREYLEGKRESGQIRSWSAAPADQGGDGCTIVEL